MNKVFIAGGVSFDRIMQLEEFLSQESQTIFSSAYRETVGSTDGGKALNLSRLGFDVTLHRVGSRMIDRSFLKESGFGPVVFLQFGERGDMAEILLGDALII